MRSNAIIPLLLAQVALGASLPIVLEDEMQAALLSSPAQHPPAPVGTRPGQQRPEGELFVDEDGDDEPAQKAFDNQPIMPSATDKPSAVLAGPHPIETAWLLALTGPTPAPSGLSAPPPDALADPEEEAEYVAAMIAELEVSRGQRTPSSRLESTPCQYAAYLSREYRDMLVISLFVTFVVVIVLAEMWEKVLVSRREAAAAAAAAATVGKGSIRLEDGEEEAIESRRRKWRLADLVLWQRMRVLVSREGAIRLEDDKTPAYRRPTEISIRASEPEPAELDAIDEKTERLL